MKKLEKKINILTLVPKSKFSKARELQGEWEKYFNINHIIDVPETLKNYIHNGPDVLFLWSKQQDEFRLEYYKELKDVKKHFRYAIVKVSRDSSDFEIYKKLADDIVYTDDWKVAKWKTIAILRRYWNTFSKPTTIIYKNIIADFIDNKITVNNIGIDLTRKEIQLLKVFMNNIGIFIPKKEIFNKIWGYEEDTSRTLDQMFFKLKKKIGPELFISSRLEGYKFE